MTRAMKPATPAKPRRPKLRVVGGEPRPPRKQAVWQTEPDACMAVEIFTDNDWSDLHPEFRPPNAFSIAGIGWVSLRRVSQEEGEEIDAQRRMMEDRLTAGVCL